MTENGVEVIRVWHGKESRLDGLVEIQRWMLRWTVGAAWLGLVVTTGGCEASPSCAEGDWDCSEDALVLTRCEGGRWTHGEA